MFRVDPTDDLVVIRRHYPVALTAGGIDSDQFPVFPSQRSSIFAIQDVAFGRIAKRQAGRLVEMNDVVYRSIHKRAKVRFKNPPRYFQVLFLRFLMLNCLNDRVGINIKMKKFKKEGLFLMFKTCYRESRM